MIRITTKYVYGYNHHHQILTMKRNKEKFCRFFSYINRHHHFLMIKKYFRKFSRLLHGCDRLTDRIQSKKKMDSKKEIKFHLQNLNESDKFLVCLYSFSQMKMKHFVIHPC